MSSSEYNNIIGDGQSHHKQKNHEIKKPHLLGKCRCPNCGHHEPRTLTVPCYAKKCPKCGAPLTEIQ